MDATRTQTANLFPVLAGILGRAQEAGGEVRLTTEELQFLASFLQTPSTFLQFQCFKTGRMIPHTAPLPRIAKTNMPIQAVFGEEPEYFTHYAMAGDELELFMMFTDAVSLNPMFARLIDMTHEFLYEHVPYCADCKSHHNENRRCHWPNDADPDRFQFKSLTQKPSK